MTPSTDLTPATTGQELMDQLGVRFSDPSELAVKIAGRLAIAATPEELFSEDSTLGWERQVGRPVRIQRVYWLQSTYDGGLGFYALVEGADADTGEQLVLTTGSVGVVIQLARAEQQGWLDQPVKLVVNERATSAGYHPHRLALA